MKYFFEYVLKGIDRITLELRKDRTPYYNDLKSDEDC